MSAKRVYQLIMVAAILAASFTSTGGVLARSGSCASYITVQWGDTLSGLASYCNTTVDAIRAANPGLGWWLYAGQVLYIPTGYAPTYYPQAGGTYVVQWGDTLGKIAVRAGVSLNDILALNPQIWNVNLIYPGQTINVPAALSAAPAPVPANYPTPVSITPTPASYSAPVNITPTLTPYSSPVNITPAATYISTPANTSSAYVPPTPINIPPTPIPVAAPQFSVLRITYGNGLLVRIGPGKEYAIIDSDYITTTYGTSMWYRKNSTTIDSKGFVWAEVTLNPQVKDYKTGWILVKDPAGKYFTTPNIDP